MTSETTVIAGARILTIPVFKDRRGAFEVFWEAVDLSAEGLAFAPVSGCHSYNERAGTLRGMHYQESSHAQSKLVSCVTGRLWDVIVDLRPDSPSYLRWDATELSAASGRSVFVPAGCAHGFVTLAPNTAVSYLIEGAYEPSFARTLRWNDPAIGIDWPVTDPILSDGDRTAPMRLQ